MRVRLKELREATVYDPAEEEAYHRSISTVSGAKGESVPPPQGRTVVVAGLQRIDASKGEFYAQVPIEEIGVGAQLGDEFELHFERARK